MPVIARPFRPDEAGVLRDIRLQALADSPRAFAERHDVALAMGGEDFGAALAAGAVWGVFDDDRCVGMAGLGRHVGANVEHKATIWGVFVTPTARGSAAARTLFQHLIDHARVIGLEVLHLAADEQNQRAQRFYKGMGFVSYGLDRRALKLGDRIVDDVLMRLDL